MMKRNEEKMPLGVINENLTLFNFLKMAMSECTVVVGSLYILSMGVNVMVICGLLVISLNCFFSRVE